MEAKEIINKMWDIDHKAQLGEDVSKEDKEFFNKYHEKMVDEMESDFKHWKYYTSKFNTTK